MRYSTQKGVGEGWGNVPAFVDRVGMNNIRKWREGNALKFIIER